MRAPIKVLMVLLVLCVGSSGATTVGADDGDTTGAVVLDTGADARVTGSIGVHIHIAANNGKTIKFPQGEPFHFTHGFDCSVENYNPCYSNKTKVHYYWIKGGIKLIPLKATLVEEGSSRQWLVNYPEGMSTNTLQTFGAVWIFNRKVRGTSAMTVKFTKP